MTAPKKLNGMKPKPKLKNGAAMAGTKKATARTMASSSSSAMVLSKNKPAATAGANVSQQQQQQEQADEEIDLNGIGTDGATGEATTSSTPMGTTSSYGGGGMGYGGGMMGMGMMPGMYGGMGMYGMGMGMGMMPGMMGSQWLFSLNQFLFGIQSVVFSLGQAVQIVGMNAQQIRHVYDSMKGMVENAVGQVNDWCKISSWEDIGGVKVDDVKRFISGGQYEALQDAGGREDVEEEEVLSQSEIIRRRRLAAFRWTVTLSVSYILYKAIRRLVRALIYGSGPRYNGRDQIQNMSASSYPMQQSSGYNSYGGMGNQYYSGGMGGRRGGYYGGGGYGQYDRYSQGYGGGSYY